MSCAVYNVAMYPITDYVQCSVLCAVKYAPEFTGQSYAQGTKYCTCEIQRTLCNIPCAI